LETVTVVAAVVERQGRILLTRRQAGTHLGGLWEFPGGKAERGETLEAALRREMKEELDTDVAVGERMETTEWEYPDKRVNIVFFRCTLRGEPRPLEGQEMAWVSREDLPNHEFPPADAALVGRLSRL
jgi:8-oxo-dGTP diphosphatase